jgi:hypothetical protein
LHRALVIFKKSRRYLPRSAMGQAIDYALSNWPLLGVYLEDGRIEIDNNLVENSIRPTAMCRKRQNSTARKRAVTKWRPSAPARPASLPEFHRFSSYR